MRLTIEWETETGAGVVKTLPVDVVNAERATKEKISEGISYTLLTNVLHSALARAAKRGEMDPLPPYAGWIDTLQDLKTIDEDTAGFPTGAERSSSPSQDTSADLPGSLA